MTTTHELRMAILGHPANPNATPWSADSLERLRHLGFNAVQVNIGWGARPNDEPLTLEDVLLQPEPAGGLPLNSRPDGRESRRRALSTRVGLARAANMRTAFNLGIPYNRHGMFGDTPPNCILDPEVVARYERQLESFAREFGVDDLWLYTYDQDAWLCSEFGDCPRCHAVPLHERLPRFLDALVAAWTAVRPGGRVWWEPWELSSGQVLAVIDAIRPDGVGLALHNNVAEVMVAFAVDRHVRNLARAAAARGIPVTLEGYLGAASEEVEPYGSLQSPLTTYHQVVRMLDVDGVTGIKEYFGLDLSQDDPNLRATAIALRGDRPSDDALLAELSEPYGDRATRREVEETWRLASEAMETYPWDASWYVREVGKSDPAHALTAAAIRGFCADTPAWRSTRGATFMAIEDREPHPWLLEDLQLRWHRTADLQARALDHARVAARGVPPAVATGFAEFIEELDGFRRRCLAYAFHCRETNLAGLLRAALERGETPRSSITAELAGVLLEDAANSGDPAILQSVDVLRHDVVEFAARYFQPVQPQLTVQDYPGESHLRRGFPQPRGAFSATSR